jgi:hypothetical protein
MQDELMAPWIRGRGRFRWVMASAMAAMVSGCGAQDEAPPSEVAPGNKPVRPKPFSGQGDFVGAGLRVRSARYVMDFALGQSTQNQDQSTSASYLVRGGLIGVNGRVK